MTLQLRGGVSLVDTDYGIAVLDEDSGQYFNLNPTGALVLRTLLNGGTCEQAAQELSTEYAVDRATANQDVTVVLEELRSAGLVLP
jgi:coenzyme PQQ synthesis protein D (PqqD)